jgi:hypothetical protein
MPTDERVRNGGAGLLAMGRGEAPLGSRKGAKAQRGKENGLRLPQALANYVWPGCLGAGGAGRGGPSGADLSAPRWK